MPRYLVTFHYREPTYEAHVGRGAKLYRGTFAVEAPTPDDAVARAREAFDGWGRASSVSWVREVVRVVCVRDDGDGSPSVGVRW